MPRTLQLNAFTQTILGARSGAPGGAILAQSGARLLTQASAVLSLQGASGGTASIGPTAQGEIWQAGFVVAVHCSTNTNEAICRIYCGAGVSPAYFVGGTTWGSTGDSSSNTPQLQVGQYVWAVWEGGDYGAEAYLSITGMRTV